MDIPQKMKNKLPNDLAIPLQGIYQKNGNQNLKEMFIAALFTVALEVEAT